MRKFSDINLNYAKNLIKKFKADLEGTEFFKLLK
jgi:hypothetical protein